MYTPRVQEAERSDPCSELPGCPEAYSKALGQLRDSVSMNKVERDSRRKNPRVSLRPPHSYTHTGALAYAHKSVPTHTYTGQKIDKSEGSRDMVRRKIQVP